ncbi:MAG TPA: uroporphyrinogen-III C-methyltransferase [Flavobacteriaceae bacterium]|jgi:uroporphyrin-III C-methyltransferase|nr:uroporphyrinogen-III C-methyltransferase [Flavobacteriaceae bacterium]HBS12220.1 uroporphyrinogen-III C-methyltransferase [Flavobacteriaceae bacterium]
MEVYKKVTLVGAGPGDVDLITVKGLKAIQTADIILYDALVNTELLKEAKADAVLVNVGKRFNRRKYSQEEIHQLLVDAANNYTTIVRLKGGDSFVFGRGAEEISFLENCGIDVEIIPGVSSALAAPSNQGIPLTKRGVNESFWVVTGTTSNGEISKDLSLAAQSTATIIILMGMRNLSKIATEILQYKSGFTPFAIIQNATMADEKIFIDSLSNYKNSIELIDYSAPGIIVIGDVVAEHPSYLEEEIQRALGVTF